MNPPEITCGGSDPKMFIQRLPVPALADCINDRREKLHGLSVEEAMNVTYFHGATKKEQLYACIDLACDICSNRIALVAAEAQNLQQSVRRSVVIVLLEKTILLRPPTEEQVDVKRIRYNSKGVGVISIAARPIYHDYKRGS